MKTLAIETFALSNIESEAALVEPSEGYMQPQTMIIDLLASELPLVGGGSGNVIFG